MLPTPVLSRPRARELLACSVLSALLVVALHILLILEPGGRVLVPGELGIEHSPIHGWVWDLWWTARALGEGQDPFETALLARFGVQELSPGPHHFLWGLCSAPLQRLGGPVVAANLVWVVAATLTPVCGYLAARIVGLGRWGSAFAAVTWGLWPRGPLLAAGAWTLAPDPFPALVGISAILWARSAHRPIGLRRARAAVPLGVALGLSVLATSGALVPATLFLLVTALRPPLTRPERRSPDQPLWSGVATLTGALVVTAIALLLADPVLRHLPGDLRAGEVRRATEQRLAEEGTHETTTTTTATATTTTTATTTAIPPAQRIDGLVAAELALVIVLALAGAVRSRGARYGCGLAALLGVCALLPQLATRGDPGASWLPVPWSPAAFLPWLLLPLCLAAAVPVDRLLSRSGHLLRLALVLVLLVGAGLSGPRTEALPPLQVASAIRELPGRGAVAWLPVPSGSHLSQLLQTIHHRPVLTSPSVVTTPARWRDWRTTAPELSAMAGGFGSASPRGLAIDLATYEVAHVLVGRSGLEQGAEPETYRVLDEMDRWERGVGDAVCAWWYRLDEAPARDP